MLKAVGCCIIYLKRISMGDIMLDENLKPGEWKEIKI
jgi:16S rRNA pseudouridine516 synthase